MEADSEFNRIQAKANILKPRQERLRKVLKMDFSQPSKDEQPPCILFSFRAKCEGDAKNFVFALKDIGFITAERVIPTYINGRAIPDVYIELVLDKPARIELLIEVSRILDDNHVIRQTLRPCSLSKNSLERDYSID